MSNQNKTVIDLFKQVSLQQPAAIAIYDGDRTIDYQTFLADIQSYSQVLLAAGVASREIVAVELARSYEFMVVVYAILNVGAAYLPIDIDSPLARKLVIIDESRVKQIITEDRTSYPQAQCCLSPHLSDFTPLLQTPCDPCPILLTDLAYVMSTSGTTGTPKGVMIEHASLLNRLLWMQKQFQIDSGDVLFQKTHICFDVSVWEIFLWSISGASVVLLPCKQESNVLLMRQLIDKYHISVIHFVPSVLSLFLQCLDTDQQAKKVRTLNSVFSSGEPLSAHCVTSFYKILPAPALLINLYGPTEASIDVSFHVCPRGKNDIIIPIGRAIDQMQIVIFDKECQPVNINEEGEIYLSGIGLARGYLNNPQQTEKSFVIIDNTRYYKTGDFGRYSKDGQLIFLGRQDQQVKLRGLRIELQEIEFFLKKHSKIKDAAVRITTDDFQQKLMVAYIILESGSSSFVFSDFISHNLPTYMLPSAYYIVDYFPLKPNGKINQEALCTMVKP